MDGIGVEQSIEGEEERYLHPTPRSHTCSPLHYGFLAHGVLDKAPCKTSLRALHRSNGRLPVRNAAIGSSFLLRNARHLPRSSFQASQSRLKSTSD